MIARAVRLTVWLGVGAVLLSGVVLAVPEHAGNQRARRSAPRWCCCSLLLVLTALVVNAAVLMARGATLGASIARGVARHAVVRRRRSCRSSSRGGRSTAAQAWVVESLRRDQRVVHRAVRLGRHQRAADRARRGSIRWLGWVVVPLAGVSLLAALLDHGRSRRRATPGCAAPGTGGRSRWRRSSSSSSSSLPWQLTTWRPAVPPTWVEPTVAALASRLPSLLLVVVRRGSARAPFRVRPRRRAADDAVDRRTTHDGRRPRTRSSRS